MIGYLHGRVIALYTDHCLLDVHGVGYRVFVANSTRTKLRQREEASLFIYTSVREDAIVLYGFATEEEYDLFHGKMRTRTYHIFCFFLKVEYRGCY